MDLTGLFAHLGNVAAHSANRFVVIVAPPVSGANVYTRIAPPKQVRYLPSPKPISLPSPRGSFYQLGYKEYFHGTSKGAAEKIFFEKYWVFGNLQKPLAIWMTTNLATAQGYAGNSGRILVLHMFSHVELTDNGDGIYTFVVYGAEPNTEYDVSIDLEPVALLDYQGFEVIE